MERKNFYYFKRKPIKLKSRHARWRGVAELLQLSARERLRVEWMIFYYTQANQNGSLTARHFGISGKTFHKWLKRFKDSLEDIESLNDQSRAPCHKRNWEVTPTQESKIKKLRKKYIHYGKKKLEILYEKE